jgi:hypothetical protein
MPWRWFLGAMKGEAHRLTGGMRSVIVPGPHGADRHGAGRERRRLWVNDSAADARDLVSQPRQCASHRHGAGRLVQTESLSCDSRAHAYQSGRGRPMASATSRASRRCADSTPRRRVRRADRPGRVWLAASRLHTRGGIYNARFGTQLSRIYRPCECNLGLVRRHCDRCSRHAARIGSGTASGSPAAPPPRRPTERVTQRRS